MRLTSRARACLNIGRRMGRPAHSSHLQARQALAPSRRSLAPRRQSERRAIWHDTSPSAAICAPDAGQPLAGACCVVGTTGARRSNCVRLSARRDTPALGHLPRTGRQRACETPQQQQQQQLQDGDSDSNRATAHRLAGHGARHAPSSRLRRQRKAEGGSALTQSDVQRAIRRRFRLTAPTPSLARSFSPRPPAAPQRKAREQKRTQPCNVDPSFLPSFLPSQRRSRPAQPTGAERFAHQGRPRARD